MKIWLDDLRPAPEGYIWCHSVNEAIKEIKVSMSWLCSGLKNLNRHSWEIQVIDCDHDLGDYAIDGGDGIKLLDWLEACGYNFPICIHTANPVGRENMRAVIKRNGWKEVY